MATRNNNNSVGDLTSMMFAQMERLNSADIDLDKEIKRGQAMTAAGTVIINAAKVQLDAQKVKLQKDKADLVQKKLAGSNHKQLGNVK